MVRIGAMVGTFVEDALTCGVFNGDCREFREKMVGNTGGIVVTDLTDYLTEADRLASPPRP